MAEFVNFMEQRAYMQAQRAGKDEKGCLPDNKERKEQRIAISEMFDMIAGSETGAIIASSLAIKNKDSGKNAHWADKSV